MATSEQLLSLVKAHYDNDDERFKIVVLQIAAHESKIGHTILAQSLKDIVMKQKTNRSSINFLKPTNNSMITRRTSKSRKSDLIVSEKLGKQINNIILEYTQRSKLNKNGYTNRRKILLEGLPGTGKTLTASVLSSELKLLSKLSSSSFFLLFFLNPFSISIIFPLITPSTKLTSYEI